MFSASARHLTSLVALSLIGSAPLAAQQPAYPAPLPSAVQQVGNCDLLASDTVRAVFLDITSTDRGDYVARFEIVEALAHEPISPHAKLNAMQVGETFSILLRNDVPGQPASIMQGLVALRPGQLAVMRLDRLFMLDPSDYGERLVCARFRPLNSSANQPAAGSEGGSQATATPNSVFKQNTSTIKYEVADDGSIREKQYINGEEIPPPELYHVDPAEESRESDTGSSSSDALPANILPEDESDVEPTTPTRLQTRRLTPSAGGNPVSISGSRAKL